MRNSDRLSERQHWRCTTFARKNNVCKDSGHLLHHSLQRNKIPRISRHPGRECLCATPPLWNVPAPFVENPAMTFDPIFQDHSFSCNENSSHSGVTVYAWSVTVYSSTLLRKRQKRRGRFPYCASFFAFADQAFSDASEASTSA